MKKPGLNYTSRIIVLVAVYFLVGLLGGHASFFKGSVELIWPPFGIGLAAILLFGYGFWPGIFCGALLFHMANGPFHGYFAVCDALGQTMGAVFCAYLLERFLQFRTDLSRVRDVAGLVGLACLLGTTVCALFSAVPLCISGVTSWDNLAATMVKWWIPNALAGLIVTPMIIVWGNPIQKPLKLTAGLEGAVCLGGLAFGTLLSFNSWFVYGLQTYPLAYLPHPFLVWGALRFGQRGAVTGTLIVSILAVRASLLGRGPFAMQSETDGWILIGCYLGILATTNMLLAAAATERSEAVRAVSESEKRYRAVVEDQNDLIWRFRGDGTVTFANDAYCRFHGKTREELIGAKYLPLLSDEDREIPLSYFQMMPPETPSVSYDYRLSLPGGTITWQQCSTRRLFDPNGHTLEFQSVAQDITRRKQIEEEARDSEQRLRAVLNTIVDGVLVADSAGIVLSSNPAAESILKRAAVDINGNSLKGFFTPVEGRLFEEAFSAHARTGTTQIVEGRACRPDKTLLPIDLGLSKVWVGGAPLLIVVLRDITERKSLEEQIRQSQKMEAVGRLAGGIAHDFNNLIQAMLGYTNLLLNLHDLDAQSRDAVEQIEKAADSAASLTGQLLAFSRKQVLQPAVFSLNRSVANMTRLVQRLIGVTIQLRTDLCARESFISADPGQIEQVILNLCVNARDAMPGGGSLTLKTSSVSTLQSLKGFSSDLQPGIYAVLSVVDTGCGIPEENRAKLFEPFFTTKELGRGTGLGLSIVYGIIKQSGGEILIESEIGKGTAFHIYLPQVDTPALIAPPRPEIPEGSRGGETVLLVEDGEVVRTLLADVLHSQGYNVLEACDGEEALNIAEKYGGSIDLIITDLVMPKISGRIVADRLLETRPGVQVLFISGYTDDETIRHGRLEGSAEFLQKPFRPDALLLKVRSILNRRIASV